MDEHEFFYSQETGGTIVSSALKLMDEVVQARYDPAQWNIYAARRRMATTGPMTPAVPRTAGEENSAGGALLQLYRNYPPAHQTLWREYEHLQATFDNFAMQHIRDRRISTRYSANCFISSHLKVKLN